MSGRLWVVATPIGNLDDITLRALRVLGEADRILAEDTRHTRRLLAHHGIPTRLTSFHAHSDQRRVEALLDELAGGARFALVSDAGTPLVSDPGIRLVAGARDRGVSVESLPGASAVMAALAVAGLRCDVFRFLGFLPRGGGRRSRILASIRRDLGATVFFESPHRIARTLADLAEQLPPDRRIAVCRELTKLHEEVVRGPAAAVLETFRDGARGEITVVVEALDGARDDIGADVDPADAVTDDEIRGWLREGLSARDASSRLVDRAGGSKRDAYQRVLGARGGPEAGGESSEGTR